VQLGIEASHSTAASNGIDPIYSLSQDQHHTISLKAELTAETGLGLLQATVYNNWVSQLSHNSLPTPIAFEVE
jgi:hypothetical protein